MSTAVTGERPDFYSFKSILTLLDFKSRNTIKAMIEKGDLKLVTVHGSPRITRASYDQYKAKLLQAD